MYISIRELEIWCILHVALHDCRGNNLQSHAEHILDLRSPAVPVTCTEEL